MMSRTKSTQTLANTCVRTSQTAVINKRQEQFWHQRHLTGVKWKGDLCAMHEGRTMCRMWVDKRKIKCDKSINDTLWCKNTLSQQCTQNVANAMLTNEEKWACVFLTLQQDEKSMFAQKWGCWHWWANGCSPLCWPCGLGVQGSHQTWRQSTALWVEVLHHGLSWLGACRQRIHLVVFQMGPDALLCLFAEGFLMCVLSHSSRCWLASKGERNWKVCWSSRS